MKKKKIETHEERQDYGKGFGSKPNFLNDFLELQQKYPECYIEAWTPEDYEAKSKEPLTIKECMVVSNYLYNYADANEGTTWNKIEHYVLKTLEDHKDQDKIK